jgi:hypothetical protein
LFAVQNPSYEKGRKEEKRVNRKLKKVEGAAEKAAMKRINK